MDFSYPDEIICFLMAVVVVRSGPHWVMEVKIAHYHMFLVGIFSQCIVQSVTGCACRINDMLFGEMIGGVTRLPTPHGVHLYIKLSDRTSVLLFFNEIFCVIASH